MYLGKAAMKIDGDKISLHEDGIVSFRPEDSHREMRILRDETLVTLEMGNAPVS